MKIIPGMRTFSCGGRAQQYPRNRLREQPVQLEVDNGLDNTNILNVCRGESYSGKEIGAGCRGELVIRM